jgi:hypothetical protein
MHILDSYALNCGVKIDKPYIYDQYYPLGEDKYITIQPSSRYPGKQYLYWNEVIGYIYDHLEEKGIKVVQIGVKDDKPIFRCIWTQGTTSINQVAYMVRHALLHVGVDSFAMHVASGYDKKSLSLHSTNWAKNTRPYWTSEEKGLTLEPEREGLKPSFQFKDPGKQTINEIKPEVVAQKALELLGIEKKVPYETIFTGENYTSTNFHLVPSSTLTTRDSINFLVMRMDLEFDEDVLYNQLQVTPSSILTDKPIDTEIIGRFSNKIKDVLYFLDEDHDIDFVKFLHSSGVNYILVSKLKGKKLDKLKFDYLDYNFIFEKKSNEEERDNILKAGSLDSLRYKSNKKILKDGKCYSSVANLNKNIADTNIGDTSFHEVLDAPSFWEDLDDFYIVKKLD